MSWEKKKDLGEWKLRNVPLALMRGMRIAAAEENTTVRNIVLHLVAQFLQNRYLKPPRKKVARTGRGKTR